MGQNVYCIVYCIMLYCMCCIFYRFRFKTPSTWRARSSYLYPLGIRWSSYNLRHWVPFRRFLRLVGLRRRYSNPPPHGLLTRLTENSRWFSFYTRSFGTDHIENTASNNSPTVAWLFFTTQTCLPCRCLKYPFWVRHSGRHPSCHNTICDVALVKVTLNDIVSAVTSKQYLSSMCCL
jgi:hypothetical protein